MELTNYIELFNDELFLITDSNSRIIYPIDFSRINYINNLTKLNDLEYIDLETGTIYNCKQITTKEGYTVKRFIDITPFKNELKNYLIDETTGLIIKKKGLIEIKNYIEEAIKSKQSFTIYMADIDRFKSTNDTYSHIIGDKVLRDVAQSLYFSFRHSNKRPKDIIARFGGEEFIGILKNTPEDETYKRRLNQVRENISKRKVKYIYPNDNHEIAISHQISIGAIQVAAYLFKDDLSQIDEVINLLINESDKLLYQSKSKGRNQITTKRLTLS